MESGDIPDENIKASSVYSPAFSASNARLNKDYKSWYAATADSQPWIQADIGYQTKVSGIITQGHFVSYPTTFKVSTFLSSINDDEVFVKTTSGKVKVNINWRVFYQNNYKRECVLLSCEYTCWLAFTFLSRRNQYALIEWPLFNVPTSTCGVFTSFSWSKCCCLHFEEINFAPLWRKNIIRVKVKQKSRNVTFLSRRNQYTTHS